MYGNEVTEVLKITVLILFNRKESSDDEIAVEILLCRFYFLDHLKISIIALNIFKVSDK